MIRKLSLAIALFVLCLVAAPRYALAYDPFGGVCSGEAAGSTVCRTNDLQQSGADQDPLIDTLSAITNIIAYVAGVAAVIIIIISALRFITSGSDVSTGSRTDTDIEDARRGLGGAFIGLAVVVLGRILILFILSKL